MRKRSYVGEKVNLLHDRGFRFDNSLGAYVNKAVLVILSIEYVDAMEAEKLKQDIDAHSGGEDWWLGYLEAPSASVREQVLEHVGCA